MRAQVLVAFKKQAANDDVSERTFVSPGRLYLYPPAASFLSVRSIHMSQNCAAHLF